MGPVPTSSDNRRPSDGEINEDGSCLLFCALLCLPFLAVLFELICYCILIKWIRFFRGLRARWLGGWFRGGNEWRWNRRSTCWLVLSFVLILSIVDPFLFPICWRIFFINFFLKMQFEVIIGDLYFSLHMRSLWNIRNVLYKVMSDFATCWAKCDICVGLLYVIFCTGQKLDKHWIKWAYPSPEQKNLKGE
jgi:hypothetical protein